MVVFFFCITGLSMIVLELLLELLSITCPDLSYFDEHPAILAISIIEKIYKVLKIYFFFIAVILCS